MTLNHVTKHKMLTNILYIIKFHKSFNNNLTQYANYNIFLNVVNLILSFR